jgi:AraC family transcriptional regulator
VHGFVEKNLHSRIHTRDLSTVARRSQSHFARRFKQAIGETPHAYVMRKQPLQRAYLLMTTTSAPLSEIALSSGFSDQAHLSRIFRQAFGQSLARWKRDLERGGETSEGANEIFIGAVLLRTRNPQRDRDESLCAPGSA